MPFWGQLVESTRHLLGPQPRSDGHPPDFQNAKADSKASFGSRQKTATGCVCKQLLGLYAFGLPGRNMRILDPRPRFQVGTQGALP